LSKAAQSPLVFARIPPVLPVIAVAAKKKPPFPSGAADISPVYAFSRKKNHIVFKIQALQG